MTKKKSDKELKDLKNLLKKKKVIIGSDRTLKMVRANNISKVLVSSNCPEHVIKDLEYYSKINNFGIVKLKQNNEELGIACKKPFNISIIGLLKGEA